MNMFSTINKSFGTPKTARILSGLSSDTRCDLVQGVVLIWNGVSILIPKGFHAKLDGVNVNTVFMKDFVT